MMLFVFPLVVLKGLLLCMRPSRGVGGSGGYAVALLVFSKAACYLEGQKKCCCCILAWTKITLLNNFLLYTVLESNRKCLEITKRVC